jgi:TPR repeat protein
MKIFFVSVLFLFTSFVSAQNCDLTSFKLEDQNIVQLNPAFSEFVKIDTDCNIGEAYLFLSEVYWVGEIVEKNVEKTVSYLELSSKHGNHLAKYNLFILFQEGHFDNAAKAIKGLKEVAEAGNEEAAILFGQSMKQISEQTGNEGFAKQGIEILKNIEFKKEKAVAEFVLSQLYNFENFTFFNPELRNKHLKNSADLGWQRAITLWTTYESLQENEKKP